MVPKHVARSFKFEGKKVKKLLSIDSHNKLIDYTLQEHYDMHCPLSET
jgi:hypothetical protein